MEATSRMGIDEIVEAEKQLLLEKNNALEAKVDSLQGQIGELQARLKVVELEAKLANKQLDKRVEAKVAELIDQLTEKTEEKIEEQNRKMNAKLELTTKIAEENNNKLQKLCDAMQENQQKFSGQQEEKMTEKDKKMEEMAKHLDQMAADLGGKLTNLESQAADCQKKQEKFVEKLASLETMANKTRVGMGKLKENLFDFMWSSSRWDIPRSDDVRLSADGLVVTTEKTLARICTQRPISLQMLAFSAVFGSQFVYYEVTLKKFKPFWIGWIDTEFLRRGIWFYQYSYAFGIDCDGDYRGTMIRNVDGYADGFSEGDVIGSGILHNCEKYKLFFTKNGKLNGKPIVLNSGEDLLYPAINFTAKDASIETNFGANPGKPFKFYIHNRDNKAELFDWN